MINFDRKQNYLCPREHWDWFVFIWKVINIAANCSERNCTRNGSFRGRPAIPQSGWQQGGAGEERLQLGQLCSQDEHHRHGGAGDTQVRVVTVHMYCVLYTCTVYCTPNRFLSQTSEAESTLHEKWIRRRLKVKEQESVSSSEWTKTAETTSWCLQGRHILCQEKENILWVNNVIRLVYNAVMVSFWR